MPARRFETPAQPNEKRLKPQFSPNPPISHADGIPGFEVFVVGTKGSGKTVFLAALYKSLQSQDKHRNAFLLKCSSAKQRGDLLEMLEQMEHKGKWPAPNYDVSNFEFMCCHDLYGEEIKLFRFKYADYPGGFIKNPPPDFSLPERIQRAHSIIILLDGQKIYDLLEKKGGDNPSIYSELDKLMTVLVECAGRPVHFLITKSDIFDFRVHHPLEKIRDALLAHRNFRNVVEQLCEFGPVHLVPVSAVGPKFAVYEKGLMKKRPDGLIEPLSVDLSIGFTLIDYIRQLKALGESSNHYGHVAGLWLVRQSRWLVDKVFILQEAAKKLNNSETLRKFTAWLPINISAVLEEIEDFAEMADSRLENIETGLEHTIKRMTDEIHDRNSALAAVIQIQAALVAAFETKFPASNLNASVAEISP
jgi:hypothetical protein